MLYLFFFLSSSKCISFFCATFTESYTKPELNSLYVHTYIANKASSDSASLLWLAQLFKQNDISNWNNQL